MNKNWIKCAKSFKEITRLEKRKKEITFFSPFSEKGVKNVAFVCKNVIVTENVGFITFMIFI